MVLSGQSQRTPSAPSHLNSASYAMLLIDIDWGNDDILCALLSFATGLAVGAYNHESLLPHLHGSLHVAKKRTADAGDHWAGKAVGWRATMQLRADAYRQKASDAYKNAAIVAPPNFPRSMLREMA